MKMSRKSAYYLYVTWWQIANLFDKYDEDGSGELDIPEMCKLMLESDVSLNVQFL